MAMCLYPEAQRKGQAELDAVLGGRLPEFNDRTSLPYISAMVKETMRWQLVTPLGACFVPFSLPKPTPFRYPAHDNRSGRIQWILYTEGDDRDGRRMVGSCPLSLCENMLTRLLGQFCTTRKSIRTLTNTSLIVSSRTVSSTVQYAIHPLRHSALEEGYALDDSSVITHSL